MTGKDELLRYIAEIKKQGSGSYTKSATFKLRSDAIETNGTVSGYFARYERIADSYGDVCKRGFLNESIKKREATGYPYPLCYGHDLDQIIGAVVEIKDRPAGAFMTAELFDTPRAQEVRDLLKSGVVYQLSFAYDVQEAGPVTLPNGRKANELRKCTLHEISIVPVPAQPLSVITEVKGQSNHARSNANLARKQADLLNLIDNMK